MFCSFDQIDGKLSLDQYLRLLRQARLACEFFTLQNGYYYCKIPKCSAVVKHQTHGGENISRHLQQKHVGVTKALALNRSEVNANV